MKKLLIIIFLFILVDGFCAFKPRAFQVKIIGITNGDTLTITILSNNTKIKVKNYIF